MGKVLMPKKEFFLRKGEVLVGSSQDVAHPYVFVRGIKKEKHLDQKQEEGAS